MNRLAALRECAEDRESALGDSLSREDVLWACDEVERLHTRTAQLKHVLGDILTTNPYVQGKAWQSGECFYCGAPWEEDGDNHAPDCLVMQAERLLDALPRTPA